MSSDSDKLSPVMGSVPFSEINFSMRRFSNICFETGEITGCSGTSPLTKKRYLKIINKQLANKVYKP